MNRLRRLVASGALAAALSCAAYPTSAAWAATRPSTRPAHHSTSTSAAARDAGEVIGFVGLVGILVAWTEGYGLLGGRIRRGGRDRYRAGPVSDEA